MAKALIASGSRLKSVDLSANDISEDGVAEIRRLFSGVCEVNLADNEGEESDLESDED